MYKFKWVEALSPDFIKKLCKYFSVEGFEKETKELVLKILKNAGGIPVLNQPVSDDSMYKAAERILIHSIRKAFVANFEMQKKHQNSFYLNEVNHKYFYETIVSSKEIHINHCSLEELVALPGIGEEKARKIINDRQVNGLYTDIKNLVDRIDGFGNKMGSALFPVLRFKSVPGQNNISEANELFNTINTIKGTNKNISFIQVLDYTLAFVSSNMNNSLFQNSNYISEDTENKYHECGWIGILQDTEYYYWLIDAFSNAKKTIDVAMFHCAISSETHPTLKLIDKLIEAKNKSVKVRVLLDNDKSTDPYKSTIINQKAFDVLNSNGIEAKFDSKDKLLHSKLVVIDDKLTVIGSHNWSAGSYFSYDDISLAIESKNLADEVKERFNALWNAH